MSKNIIDMLGREHGNAKRPKPTQDESGFDAGTMPAPEPSKRPRTKNDAGFDIEPHIAPERTWKGGE
jgi:hypothetical protein